jgi:hypothetical protein
MSISKIKPYLPLPGFNKDCDPTIPPSHFSLPSDPRSLEEKVSSSAKSALSALDFDLFKNELLKKYEPKVVQALFERLQEMGKTDLTLGDRERFEVWCHYFEVESSFKEQFYGTSSATTRLLNHYLKYSQEEAYFRISHASNAPCLTHENILLCKHNIERFIDCHQQLIEEFGEFICHRALTKTSLFPSDVLLGIESLPKTEDLKSIIYKYYQDEITIRKLIESLPFDDLRAQSDTLRKQIVKLKSPSVAEELFKELAIKAGRTDWLRCPFPREVIKNQAELFEACRLGQAWAKNQEELEPIPGAGKRASQTRGPVNINLVYFLNHPNSPEEDRPVAVLKRAKESSSIEKLVYDAALIFGLESAVVPTKFSTFKNKSGSVQTYQNGISWSDFQKIGASNKSSNLMNSEQQKIIQSISMEDFLKAGIATLIFGNRDLHLGNFLLVEKEDGSYKIVIFDNGECFFPSNTILLDRKGKCHLPLRNSLLIFPQADYPIQGDLKKRFQSFIRSYESKFKQFIQYLDSPTGKDTLRGFPKQKLNSEQIRAFKVRLERLITMVNIPDNFTYRDLVYSLFPLYELFLQLTMITHPDYPEIFVGYHPAEELCDQAISVGKMTKEEKEGIIKMIKDHQYD